MSVIRGNKEGIRSRRKIAAVSLGCDKNRIDTEIMLGLLEKAGFLITSSEKEADIFIINTCAFIREAKEESIETILTMAKHKTGGSCKSIIVTGCLAQRYSDVLLDEMPEIEAVVGTGKVTEIVDIVNKVSTGKRVCYVGEPGYKYRENYPRILTTPGHYAYIKIADGCNNRCSYCIIPKLRGTYCSRSIEKIAAEAVELAALGVKELILVAQDTTYYGRDLYGKFCLPELLRRLSCVQGISWIRVLYAHPNLITEDLIDTMASEKKICKYLDIPLQHSSKKILQGMGRSSDQDKSLRLVKRLRKEIPGIILRSTFIVGFPGETEEDFEELLEFMKRAKLDHVGVFIYSREEGTAAAVLPGQIPEKVKLERYRRAMELQAEISRQNNLQFVGKVKKVLVEESLSCKQMKGIHGINIQGNSKKYYYAGRSEGDAPDVDGNVYFTSDEKNSRGDFVSVLIKDAGTYDLFGEKVRLIPAIT